MDIKARVARLLENDKVGPEICQAVRQLGGMMMHQSDLEDWARGDLRLHEDAVDIVAAYARGHIGFNAGTACRQDGVAIQQRRMPVPVQRAYDPDAAKPAMPKPKAVS